MDGASKAALDNEFGTHVDEDVIKQILEKGSAQESQVSFSALPPFSPSLLFVLSSSFVSSIPRGAVRPSGPLDYRFLTEMFYLSYRNVKARRTIPKVNG